jgi:hypothetical protein
MVDFSIIRYFPQPKLYPALAGLHQSPQPKFHSFTEGKRDLSVWGIHFAALKRVINSWFTLSST